MTALARERVLEIGEVTRTDFVKFAGAGGDFNPIHHDDEAARAAGFPSVFAMGMLTASLASRLVTDWVGLAEVRRFDVRFRAMVWPGEVLTARGKFAGEQVIDDEKCAQIEFDVVNGDGEVKLTGRAVARDDGAA